MVLVETELVQKEQPQEANFHYLQDCEMARAKTYDPSKSGKCLHIQPLEFSKRNARGEKMSISHKPSPCNITSCTVNLPLRTPPSDMNWYKATEQHYRKISFLCWMQGETLTKDEEKASSSPPFTLITSGRTHMERYTVIEGTVPVIT